METTTTTTFTDTSDLCQQLLDRYGNSAAPQHRHLCAIAAANRSIIQSESLPLTPLSYFAATISTLSDVQSQLDQEALAALSSFLSIVLPLVPENAISPDKAKEAVEVVVRRVNCTSESEVFLGTASARALIKSLGLLVGFCDLEDWNSVEFGFNTLLHFSIDKRPKVRKCAQDCILATFKLFKSSAVIKKASKLLLSLLKNRMPLAIKMCTLNTADVSKDDITSQPEFQEVQHVLNLLKTVVPYLSAKACSKLLLQISQLLSSEFPALSRHVFYVIEVIFETSGVEVTAPDAVNILKPLLSYINLRKKNPMDTVLVAANLAKRAIDKLHQSEITEWINYFPLVIGSIASLLKCKSSIAVESSKLLKGLIKHHIDEEFILTIKEHEEGDKASCCGEQRVTKSICDVFASLLSSKRSIPNEHVLAVISVLFLRLGEVSDLFMKDILVKLAEVMTLSSMDGSDTIDLQKCVGSAIVAMGPEKLLDLLSTSLNSEDLSFSDTWLMPTLKEYIVGSSLGFFMEHIVPLAQSLQKCHEVGTSEIGQDRRVNGFKPWELLPAFCCYPTDVYENFGALAKLLVSCTKEPFVLENVANALKELVNQNKNILASDEGPQGFSKLLKLEEAEFFMPMLKSKYSYSKKTANKNIRALASCSKELLQALIDAMFELPPDRHKYLKDAIGCLASINDPSVTKDIFTSELKKHELVHDFGDFGQLESQDKVAVDNNEINATSEEKDSKRCLILDLASSFVDGASEDLIDLLFKFTRNALEEATGMVQSAAYHTLSRMLETQPSSFSSKLTEVMDLLMSLKSPSDFTSPKSRLACFRTLLIYAVKANLGEEETKAFLFLNEIILTLKDSKEEGRKAAYDILIEISSNLRKSSSVASDGPYHKLITMVLGYLSGSSPQITSGAISALSVLVYDDMDICLSVPDLVPSVLALLHSRAIEVIKAVLGFVKVLVSTLKAQDLQNFLSDIVQGILPWSSLTRHHFKSKVTVILEILMRKCSPGAIRSLTPPKYGDFVKSVSENRHGKTDSKNADAADTESKPPLASPIGGRQKRKREESRDLPKEGFSGFKRRNRDNNQKSVNLNAKGPHLSSDRNKSLRFNRKGDGNHDEQRGGGSPWQNRDKGNNFKKGQSWTNRKNDRRDAAKKNKVDTHKPSGKISKPKVMGKKPRKTNK